MITRIFKNNNFTVKLDRWENAPGTFEAFFEMIQNDIDAPDICTDFEIAPCYYGNSYAVYEVCFFVNEKPRFYHIRPEALEAFNSHKCARIEYRENAPLFTLPTFYKFDAFTNSDGVKGTLYTLEKEPSADEWEAMGAAGCERYRVQAQYAPELAHTAVFVPNGTTFQFA